MSDVTISFGAKDEGLKSAISGAQKGVSALTKAFASLGVSAAAVGAAKFAFDAFKGLADYAGGIADLAAQTGLSAQATMVWGQALKNAGLGADALGGLVNKLQRALTGVNEQGEPTNKAFERLGMNMDALRAMRPDQQMDAVAAAIAAIPDPAQRAATAIEIFGKSGGKALALFTDSGALTTAREQLGSLAENLGANIESLDKLSDALNAAGEIKSMQIMAGFSSGFSGDMNAAADAINKMDFSKAAQDLGYMARGARELVAALEKLPGVGGLVANAGEVAGRAAKGAAGSLPLFGPLVTAGMYGAGKLRDMGQKSVEAEQAAKAEDIAAPAAATVTAIEEANNQLGASLTLMTDLSDMSASNLSLQDSYSSAITGAAEQMSVMVDSQNALNAAKEKEVEVAKKAAEIERDKLNDLKSQTSERLQAAQSQLGRIANADVSAVGAKGSRQRAARKAMQLEEDAADAEAFGNTDKAKKLRERAGKFREKAFAGEDKTGTAEASLKAIDDGIKELNKKLPTPALAP
jgi:hypothetical protein